MTHDAFRAQVCAALSNALQPLPSVVAGWEGGSAAYGAVDEYSDIDLNFLVEDDASLELVYAAAEQAMETISPIEAKYEAPPGRYYKLKDANEFILVDLCLFRVETAGRSLDVERHGRVIPLFDKGDWFQSQWSDAEAVAAKRDDRFRELQTWFLISQGFVRKAILRSRDVEAATAFWNYTLKPLAELLRMRYCRVRWDFGLRYLDRDLPPAMYDRFRELTFVSDLQDLDCKLRSAVSWGAALLQELEWTAQPGATVTNDADTMTRF